MAQTAQNPEGHRYAADCSGPTRRADGWPRCCATSGASCDTEHSFSIWYGWAPTRALPDMAFSLEGNVYLATYAIWTDPADDERYRDWVHGRRPRRRATAGGRLPRRLRLHPPAGPLPHRRELRAGSSRSARVRDPDGRFASYLTADRERLNVHG